MPPSGDPKSIFSSDTAYGFIVEASFNQLRRQLYGGLFTQYSDDLVY